MLMHVRTDCDWLMPITVYLHVKDNSKIDISRSSA